MSDWNEINREILDRLDLLSEFQAVGVDVVGKENSKGWMSCRAYKRDDRDPSAGVNIGASHPQRGRYKEFVGDGRNMSFFEFMAMAGASGHEDGWEGVRNEYAKKLGIKLPKKKSGQDSSLVFTEYNHDLVASWCLQHKQGINPYAVKAVGARLASHYGRYNVIALPVYGEHVFDDSPSGWVLYSLSGGPLPIFQGKDREPIWKKMKSTQGSSSGWMGAYGLSIIESAKYVWTPEGPSDMMAIQSTVPKSEIRSHAVLANSGGTMEILADWMLKLLSGKIAIVPLDCDVPGVRGAMRRAKQICEVASETYLYRPPFRLVKKHGPDIRDYVSGLIRPCAACRGTGNSSGIHDKIPENIDEHYSPVELGDCTSCGGNGIAKDESLAMPLPTFEDMLVSALSNPYVADGEPEIGELSSDADVWKTICDDLGIIVVERLSTRDFLVWSKTHRDYFEVDTAHLKFVDLLAICGHHVHQKVHLGVDNIPGMYKIHEVADAIATVGGYCQTQGSSKGRGCWSGYDSKDPMHKSIVLVGAREAAVFNGKGKIEMHDTPFVSGLTINIGNDEHWFDHSKLDHYLERSADYDWCRDQVDKLIELCEKWYWKQKSAAAIAAGLVLATWVQTIWRWRPLVSIVGASDSGKSSFFKMLENIYGGLALLSSKSNDVGLRQAIGNQACVVLCDEFESDQYRRRILEFFRTSSQGSQILRGSTNQRGVRFGLRHICWVAAVEVGMDREPDKNRFISLELGRPPAGKRGTLSLPSISELNDFGQRLLAVSIRHIWRAMEYASELQTCVFPGVHGRMVESLAVPVGMLASTSGVDVQTAKVGLFPEIISGFQIEDERGLLDESGLMHTILSSQVDLGRGDRVTVSQALSATPDEFVRYSDAMERAGVSKTKAPGRLSPSPVICKTGKETVRALFIAHETCKRFLMKGTPWEYQALDQILKRLPGAEKSRRRIAGHLAHGVLIPLDYVESEFMGERDESHPQLF